jgi:hypothetical protein
MKPSKYEVERQLATRVGHAGGRVDLLVARVRETAHTRSDNVARRVDALRAHEARVHTRLREMREADEAGWTEHSAELGRELDELEAKTTIAEMRLEAERATHDRVFEAAINAELDAWDAYADTAQARAVSAEPTAYKQLDAAVRTLRERLAHARRTVGEALTGRRLPTPAAHAAIRRAIVELDRAAEDIASMHPKGVR